LTCIDYTDAGGVGGDGGDGGGGGGSELCSMRSLPFTYFTTSIQGHHDVIN
jgi:hypothetical protein